MGPGSAAARRELADASDGELISATREGDASAFGELWTRHRGAALVAARAFTSSLDPEDLVAEAYAVILRALRQGGGPRGDAFRPYLNTVVRNLARRWGSERVELSTDELPELGEGDPVLEEQLGGLDHRLVRQAFESLPARWREALWHAEVEGRGPAEFAAALGLTPNAAAALVYRAREGLRQAWLQAHVADAQAEGECGWVLAHLGEHGRDALRKRAARRLTAHLQTCDSCHAVAGEVRRANFRVAALLPVALGAGGAGAWLAAPAPPAAAAAGGLALGVSGAAAAVVAAVVAVGGVSIGAAATPEPPAAPVTAAPAGLLPDVGAAGAPTFADPAPTAIPAPPGPAQPGPAAPLGGITGDAVGAAGEALARAGEAVGDAVGGVVDEVTPVEIGAAADADSVEAGASVGDAARVDAELGDGLLELEVDIPGILDVRLGGH